MTACGCLIGLDKCLGMHLIGVRDILRRLVSKVCLLIIRLEATRACSLDQLCGGLNAGIEGAIYHARSAWDVNCLKDKDWGALLIDARNAFNEGN